MMEKKKDHHFRELLLIGQLTLKINKKQMSEVLGITQNAYSQFLHKRYPANKKRQIYYRRLIEAEIQRKLIKNQGEGIEDGKSKS